MGLPRGYIARKQQAIKKPAPKEHWQREYVQPFDYALMCYALVDAVKESKKRELIHFLRVI